MPTLRPSQVPLVRWSTSPVGLTILAQGGKWTQTPIQRMPDTHDENAQPARPSHALLYFSHVFNERTLKKFEEMKQAFAPYGDSFTLTFSAPGSLPPPAGFSAYVTDRDMLDSLGYTWMHDALMPGHTNYPVMHFAVNHPQYESFTVVEYDIGLTATWDVFFRHLMDAEGDLLVTHLSTRDEQPRWAWWSTIGLEETSYASDPDFPMLRFFGPLYRLSGPGVRAAHEAYLQGARGHYETLLPSVLAARGFRIRDLNEITHPAYTGSNRWYTKQRRDRTGQLKRSSMRFRPNRLVPGLRPYTLYHPIKYGWRELLGLAWSGWKGRRPD